MKHIYLFLLIGITSAYAQSPNLAWVQTGGADYSDGILAMDRDASGNIYVAGFYSNEAQFGNVTLPQNTFGMFTAKYDTSGALIWIKSFQNTDFINVTALKVDAQGGIVITGDTYMETDIDPSENEYMLPFTEGTRGFIAKYDNDGDFLWAGQIVGSNTYVSDVAFDTASNLYVTGRFYTSADLDIKAGTAAVSGSEDSNVFVASYNQNGDYAWGFTLESDGSTSGNGITVRNQSVFVTGSCFQNTDFDPSSAQAIKTIGFYGGFLAKYSTSGNYQWAHAFQSATDQFDVLEGIKVGADASGNVYMLGYFTETFDADPSDATALINGSDFYDNSFLAKYDAAGNYVWAVAATGDDNEGGEARPFCLSVDNAGNAAIAGLTDGILHLNSFDSTTMNLTGETDIFTAVYDAAGQLKSGIVIGSNDESFKQMQNDDIGGVLLTEAELYIAGRFTTTTNFAFADKPPFEITIDPLDYSDAFLAKYALQNLGTDETSHDPVAIYPNPTRDILHLEGIDAPVDIFDVTGRHLASYPAHTTQIDMSGLSVGTYILKSEKTSVKILKK